MSAPATRGSSAISVAGGAIVIGVFQVMSNWVDLCTGNEEEREGNIWVSWYNESNYTFMVHVGWGPAITGLGNIQAFGGAFSTPPVPTQAGHSGSAVESSGSYLPTYFLSLPTGAATLSLILHSYCCSAATNANYRVRFISAFHASPHPSTSYKYTTVGLEKEACACRPERIYVVVVLPF